MASSVEVPKVKLSDGLEMPAIALGTYLGFDQNGIIKPKDNELRDVVVRALVVGWRHFDTAAIYSTEGELGEAVRQGIEGGIEAVRQGIEGGIVTRGDLFITTKLWNTHHKREQVAEAMRESLKELGLNYVDLYLVHWPIGLNEDYTYSEVDYMETWRGMEDVHKLGLAKSIGVSNFNKQQLERVLREGSVKPVALQIEVHPQIVQTELVNYAQSEGLVVMAYSPFGSLVSRFGMQLPGPKIDDPALLEIAQKYGKSTPQVVLRWLVDRNIVPVPKTINPKRLEENIDIFDFKLDKNETSIVGSYNDNTRYTLPSFWQTHPHYPFEKVANPIAATPFGRKS